MALEDASGAAAIVIALSDDAPLHAAAEAWLTALAARHHGAQIGVIAVLNDEPWTVRLEQTEVPAASRAPSVHRTSTASGVVALSEKKISARAA